MAVSVYNFIVFLQVFFPGGLSMQQTLYVIAILASIYPLFRLHQNQHREPRQPPATGWYRSILLLLSRAFHPERNDPELWLDEGPGDEYAQAMCDDLGQLYEFLGIPGSSAGHNNFFPEPRTILVTSRLTCVFCPASDGIYSLRRRRKVNFRWVNADLFIAYCRACDAEYYPDRITYRLPNQPRRERLEYDAKVLRVSKHENSILRFRSGWSNFAEWLGDTVGAKPRVTPRQSQLLANTVREQIGLDGGVVAGAMEHGCMDCTHLKRYKSDLVATGASLGDRIDGIADDLMENQVPNVPATLGEEMPPPPMQTGIPSEPEQQEFPPQNGRRGYIHLAVMDGKTIKHKICSVDLCHKPLVNYKNGRFCEDHLDLRDICGIVPCGRAVHSSGAFTCDNAAHKDWHVKYHNRFSRMSFPGVQRVIHRQLGGGPSLRAEIPDLNGVAGAQVSHTFRAGTTYCLQTIQWSCRCPIAWGKCYRSESSSQVLAFLNRTWEHHPNSKPSFIAYDDACNFLRHIVTQDANSPWIRTTKFIVDAWHYIGHRATDVLCRLWCNPDPTNGSQPDLVLVDLNAWLNGFEAQLRQMSATNYDFCVHVLMFLYKEMVEERILKKQRTLSDEFWGAVEGITRE
ncbi:hypothetical protein B0H14DRAFT_3117558 [Mycena olivaceomarginata]|nr:hypothetical protein B0H14DRAFT_3117558 [Mycena olivaceomarginata]